MLALRVPALTVIPPVKVFPAARVSEPEPPLTMLAVVPPIAGVTTVLPDPSKVMANVAGLKVVVAKVRLPLVMLFRIVLAAAAV